MKKCTLKQLVLLTAMCGIMMSINMSAQTYLRYVKPEDLGTKAVYADSVLSSITLPRGVAKLYNYPKFNVAALELAQILNDPTKELMQVYVCGSASPDGLWGDNVKLSQARTDAAASYLMSVLGIPSYKIHKESLNEDWDRLYELVADSDLPYKYNVMSIIRSMEWGERKKALQSLDGGKVWKILERDFFPQLRCVRFAIFCKWDSSRPYMTVPVADVAEKPLESKTDTVYVRDTVFYVKETVYVPEQTVVTPSDVRSAYDEYREESMTRIRREPKVWDTPWMMGFKTNLLADAIAVPSFGMEIQLADHLSLDIQGWYTNTNIFVQSDDNTNVYGVTPELRWWIGNRTMRRGSFIGLHGRCAWYTLQWKDGFLYQNGPEDVWEGDYLNAGNHHPAWSAGITYGYSLGLGRKAHWGLEFVIGVGYANYSQNTATYADEIWEFVEHQDMHHFGITRLGVNLTYRFSLRKVNPDYYEK